MSLLQLRAGRITVGALATVGLALGFPLLHASADPSDATVCTAAGNVWVHVEVDDAVQGGCATEFATGFDALTSAGFEFEASADGFLTTINGAPADPGAEDWWSYTHTDEGLTAWEFYEVGAKQSEPVAGSIEGWRLMHTFDQDVDTLPTTTPAELLAEVEASPGPSVSPEPSDSTAPSPTVAPSTTAPSTTPRPSLPSTGN